MNQTREKITDIIIRSPGCLLLVCPDLTWNQVFCELDPTSRDGEVRLTAKGRGCMR
ncbi:MAG TPA: hypothetical protein VLE46_15395 [Nitrospira sp.]|nr:hypothetical protein [Nitrospira sp.]